MHFTSLPKVLEQLKMRKNMQHQESSNISLQNGKDPRCMNKIFHALNRRHRWQNVRKVMPNKRQGSGKQIIDGGTSEPTSDQRQPQEIHHDPNKNKSKIEQTGTESTAVSSKASKKNRIRSLISDEMAKRRGINCWRRASSPTRSPLRKTNSRNKIKGAIESGKNEKPPTNVVESNCESPSTTKKKRKSDICAAMLTVSYLKQKGLANEHQIDEQDIDEDEQPAASLEMLQVSDGHDTHNLHSKIGLTKSFSFPILGSTKTKDFELEEFKKKIKDCKDLHTTKEKFILSLNQWMDTGFLKPMLTRPSSFKSSSTTSQKEKKQTTNNSKSLKQRFGFAVKDNRKEKRRILMDAVFHKIPYGRRSSKDPKKISPEKLKSRTTTSSSRIDQSGCTEKPCSLKKTSSTSEAMSKYRKLLSQTSTRDEKLHLTDHKPKLFVAGENCHGSSTRMTHKRIRSLPNISPYDFKDNHEFPVKLNMDMHLSISNAIFDEEKFSDHFVYAERRNFPTSVTETGSAANFVFDEQFDRQKESSSAIKNGGKETKLVKKDEAIDENLRVCQKSSNHQEKNDHQKELSDAIEATAKESDSVNKDEVVDENLGMGQDKSNRQEKIDNEPRVVIETEKDKNFSDILGMFKQASDERKKQNQEMESSSVSRKVSKNTSVDKHHGAHKKLEAGQKTLNHQEKDKSELISDSGVNNEQGIHKNLEDGNKTLDHQEKDHLPLTSDSKDECFVQDSVVDSSSLVNISHSPLKDFSDKNQQRISFNMDKLSTHDKRPYNQKALDMSSIDAQMMETGFLHLNIESLMDNAEFQFVKEVLEHSGFIENDLLGEWYSTFQPINPVLFEEVETSFLQTKNLEELDSMKDEEVAEKIISDHHLLLFDLVNEALLELHNNTFTYCPHPLTYRSKVRPMPVGSRVLEKVWDIVTKYLSWKQELQPSLDDVVSRDLLKGDGWMNLQADAEFVGIELEEMITDDLLDELVFDDLLM